jgi:hypothetical protein
MCLYGIFLNGAGYTAVFEGIDDASRGQEDKAIYYEAGGLVAHWLT